MFMLSNTFLGCLIDDISTLSKKKKARLKNNMKFMMVFRRLIGDALYGRYGIEGLPDTVSLRILLRDLWAKSYGVIYLEKGVPVCLPSMIGGDSLNVVGEPGTAWVNAINGKVNKQIKLVIPGADVTSFLGKPDGIGVLIRENPMYMPFAETTIAYSLAIADAMRTLDVCSTNMKCPFIVVAEQSIVNTVKEFFNDRDENLDYIVSSGVFPVDKINILPFDPQAKNLTQCTQLIDWLENKYREACGIPCNGQMDKKGENLISGELDVSKDYSILQKMKPIDELNRSFKLLNSFMELNVKAVDPFDRPEYNEEGEEDTDEQSNKDIKSDKE